MSMGLSPNNCEFEKKREEKIINAMFTQVLEIKIVASSFLG